MMPRPTLEEMRPVCQPSSVMGRPNGEHWVGRLWGRKVSLRITRLLAPTRVTPDAVTYTMIAVGLLGAVSLALPGLAGALGAAICIQLYLVIDCVDGELARWRQQTSLRGAYLDRLGHYVVEAGLFAMYGYHVVQTWASGWAAASVGIALLAILTKAQTDLVYAVGGGAHHTATDQVPEPEVTSLRTLRRIVHPLKIHRITGAAEATIVMAVAALALELGWEDAERAAIVAFGVVAVGLFFGHGVSILTSRRIE